MNTVDQLVRWVQRKPLILIRFDKEYSLSLYNSPQRFERLTLTQRHSVFQSINLPTLCLLEVRYSDAKTCCYLATAIRKKTVSTFDSLLTIEKLRIVLPASLQGIKTLISDVQMLRLMEECLPDEGCVISLSPQLSAYLLGILSENLANQPALETAFSLLLGWRQATNIHWGQKNAIQVAIDAFGLRDKVIPAKVVLKKNATSGLSLVGAYIYEDNVVHADASKLPGFKMISSDVTGRAEFQKGNERLVIYTANKLPLEQMLGVDLIYINETRGNIVMIQYKMLEERASEGNGRDWLFRPDQQLYDEVARMKLPDFCGMVNDYRLNSNPFFFKFVKRTIESDNHRSFIVSLEHLRQILYSSESKGPKGGIRLSCNALDGTYLRENDIIGLIRSGYIGTHRAETESLKVLIKVAAEGNKAIILAWQKKIQEVISKSDKPLS
ncbi:hypothetical protein [uncultured Desulfovibrio sp.]|uniref:hypothetical protein n=1 Tax=uncultured Desulfovibrio sp. TaxID=167968 RepID=UPI002631B351|nr:hypothetical protein [uncultured Desulfovibrio sp.]